MDNAEKMWHAWRNSPEVKDVFEGSDYPKAVQESVKFGFLTGYRAAEKVAVNRPAPTPRAADE